MACVAAVLLVLIVVVRYWPSDFRGGTMPTYLAAELETVALEDILPTSQTASERPPPPPLPPIPVEEPPDLVFDDVLNFDVNLPDMPGPPSDGRDFTGDDRTGSASTARSARPVRFVEPEYTRDARRRNIRAQIVVEVTVDERGRVVDKRILERYMAGGSSSALESVTQIGFGLEESALSAAERFLFRPAEFRGEPVRSQYQLRFSFGV
jgi:periplasmic protein TonB